MTKLHWIAVGAAIGLGYAAIFVAIYLRGRRVARERREALDRLAPRAAESDPDSVEHRLIDTLGQSPSA